MSGYAGGREPDPSYLQMKDHTETVLVEYDPEVVSYEQLLDVFWASHTPTYEVFGRQYRNVILYQSEQQKRSAEHSRAQIKDKLKRTIYTPIEKATAFYPAEDYHQKYYLRKTDRIFEDFRTRFPSEESFAASTAAARLNGYLGCYGELEDLQRELDQLGLSVEAQNYLVEHLTVACEHFEGLTCPAPAK